MTRNDLRTAGPQELVVLVHGTHAACDADGGDAWWQCDSWTWRELSRRLPPGLRLQQRGEVFHWSGENADRARVRAARALLEYLRQLEQKKQSYHLIGHGHGGTVIWYALRLAERRHEKLQRLRSWATVGTPFLHFRSHRFWSIAGLCNLLLALLLALPVWHLLHSYLTARAGQPVGWGWATGGGFRLPYPPDGHLHALIWGGWQKLAELLNIPLRHSAAELVIGTFHPENGLSLLQYLYQSGEGRALLGLGLVATFVFANVVVQVLGLVLDLVGLRADQCRDRALLKAYRGRWLGIWSPDDEELNGLQAALETRFSLVNRMGVWRGTIRLDHVAPVARPYYWIFTPVFNLAVRPVLNWLARTAVIRTAQGNDRPAATVARITVAPTIPYPPDQFPALPAWLNQRLVDSANSHLRNAVPQLRTLLVGPTLASGLERFGPVLSGRELVHTSYFDHSEVLDLLAMHMAWSLGKLDVTAQRGGSKRELLPWLLEFKRQVGQDGELRDGQLGSGASPAKPHALRQLLRPRQRARQRLTLPR